MKTESLLLIAAVAVVGYLVLVRKPAAVRPMTTPGVSPSATASPWAQIGQFLGGAVAQYQAGSGGGAASAIDYSQPADVLNPDGIAV